MKNNKTDLEFKIEFSTKIDSYLEPVLQKVINQIGKNLQESIKEVMYCYDPRDGVEYYLNKPKLISWYCKANLKNNEPKTNPKT